MGRGRVTSGTVSTLETVKKRKKTLVILHSVRAGATSHPLIDDKPIVSEPTSGSCTTFSVLHLAFGTRIA